MILDFKPYLLIFLLALFINYILIKYDFFSNKNSNKQIQDVHINNPSRLGGLTFYILFFGYETLVLSNFNTLFWCSSAILLIATLEDIRISIRPKVRLFIILISCLVLILDFNNLPNFNFGSLNVLFNSYPFQIIFFTFGIATVINGQNIIDGTNGLSALTSLCTFCGILFLGFLVNDIFIIEKSIFIITLILSFLIFNYPSGKIFLGDTGSYFLGLMASYLVIYLFSNYNQIPNWSAVIIIFYPTTEVCFSYFRKIKQKKSPFFPDDEHLHQKIFYLLLNKTNKNKVLCNALVSPTLAILWFGPLLLLPFSIIDEYLSMFLLIALLLLYFFFYFLVSKYEKQITVK